MDSTSSLKRRRPHLYGGDTYELHSQSSIPLQPDYLSTCNPSDQYFDILQLQQGDVHYLSQPYYDSYILQSAAQILQCSPQHLIESTYSQRSHQSPQHKRQRRSIEIPSPNMHQGFMNNAFGQDPEKYGRSMSLDSHSLDQRNSLFPLPLATGGSFLVSTASGVVDCLAGLATCQGPVTDGSSSDYEVALSTPAAPVAVPPEASQYMGSISHADTGRPGALIQVSEPYSNGYVAPEVENWLSDSSTESAHYMQSYPALQPTIVAPTTGSPTSHLTRVQPSTHSESMYYPNGQLAHACSKAEIASGVEPILVNPAAPMPIIAVSTPISDSQTPRESMQQPLGGVSYAMDTPSIATTMYHHPAMQSMVTTTGTYVAVSANASLCPAPIVVPGPPTPSTAVSPHYMHMPPVATQHPQHHHHYVLGHMPIATYMGEPNVTMSERPSQRPPAARRGPFKDQTIRQKTAQTRKDGSCIRCRMQRIRCEAVAGDTKGPCMCCLKPCSRSWRLPCMRLKINDVVLAKTTQVKGHEWTLRWKDNTVLDDVGHWASSEVRTLRISEGYTGDFVELRVRKFIPQKGDSLVRSWVAPDGTARSVQIPPYAIIEPEAIGQQYGNYIKNGLMNCCRNVLIDLHDTLIWDTYAKALELAHTPGIVSDTERDVLATVLELWMTVRLTTRSFEIVGTETLDMPADILDETSPSHGKIPIPPVMGAQLDSVLIHQIQHNLRKDALKKLGKVITENRTNTWISIYLSIFVLLHNAALVIKHDASYARKHGIKRRFAREEKVHQYHAGAVTLLAYFHYCNKGVFPFTAAAKETDIRNIANLNDDGMKFVRETRRVVMEHKKEWQALVDNDEYENDYYFVSQMYEENWQPRAMKP